MKKLSITLKNYIDRYGIDFKLIIIDLETEEIPYSDYTYNIDGNELVKELLPREVLFSKFIHAPLCIEDVTKGDLYIVLDKKEDILDNIEPLHKFFSEM